MPYPNEHACRVQDPEQFERFTRDNDVDPNEIHGVREDESTELQSYRYPTQRWDEPSARDHCQEHGGEFEPASDDGDQQQAAPALDLSTIRDLRVPNLSQYFGIWAYEPQRFMALFTQVARMDLRQHVQQAQVDRQGASIQKRGAGDGETKIAVVSLTGALTKRPASLSDDTSTIQARQQVRAARRSSDVAGLVLRIDSPGGSLAGTPDLADEVAAAAQEMPVTAFIEDLTASAAYWVASQATRVVANHSTAMVGSIGSFIGLYDLSGLAGQEGIKPVLITSGGVKGMGFPGTEITAEHKEMLQGLVDHSQAQFNQAIASGRALNLAQVEQLADGRIHPADRAMQLGLIDAIESFDATLSQIKQSVRGRSAQNNGTRTGDAAMSQNQNGNDQQDTQQQPAPATLQQLKDKFPHNTAEDREHCLEQNMSLEQAGEYMSSALAARLENREEQLEQQGNRSPRGTVGERANQKRGRSAGGGDEDEATGDALADFNAAVRQRMTDRNMSRMDAVRSVAKTDPDLYQRYLMETNDKTGQAALREKFQEDA